MGLILDTDTALALIRAQPAAVRTHFRAVHESGDLVALSAISVFELWCGVGRSQRVAENTARVADFLGGPLEILEFTDRDAARAGLIRAELAASGTPIGPYDVLIAAQAVVHGFTLVTGNGREFGRISDLEMTSWLD